MCDDNQSMSYFCFLGKKLFACHKNTNSQRQLNKIRAENANRKYIYIVLIRNHWEQIKVKVLKGAL